ncbi:MAG: hypothetical protein E7571_08570 [Ruminococcaceae bacterium]|nr:hypothetical protein [Oscillospiraceae bacterium]
MNKKFIAPDMSDKRISFAAEYLEDFGYIKVNNESNADFVLLGVNPPKEFLRYSIPCFAGNITAQNIYDYTKAEAFALENAYLTAEGAVAIAVNESDISLINANILIAGYGRIGKALHRYLQPFSNNITVCARKETDRVLSVANGSKAVDFDKLNEYCGYDYIFNTVPHPVFNEAELRSMKKRTLIIDLASFPGGVDVHFAEYLGVKLLTARGLPAKCSPQSAGKVVAKTVDKLVREVIV